MIVFYTGEKNTRKSVYL